VKVRVKSTLIDPEVSTLEQGAVAMSMSIMFTPKSIHVLLMLYDTRLDYYCRREQT